MKFNSILLTICLLGTSSSSLLAVNPERDMEIYSVQEWKRKLQFWKEKLNKEKDPKNSTQTHIINIQDHLLKLVESKLGALEEWAKL